MRFFFHISFTGTQYHGWQRQKSALSVQEVIEQMLSEVLKTPLQIKGCGRTDAGVHASNYYFHVDIDALPEYDLLFRINKRLPGDIAVLKIIEVAQNAHARFDASQRMYRYFIHRTKDPFLESLSSYYGNIELDLAAMQEAVKQLIGHHDFYSFCRTPDRHKTTDCKVSSAELFTSPDENALCFEISANRFLSGMIRIIIARLLEVGRGKMDLEYFRKLLNEPILESHLRPAYPQGLYLCEVRYPYIDRSSMPDITDALFQYGRLKKIEGDWGGLSCED